MKLKRQISLAIVLALSGAVGLPSIARVKVNPQHSNRSAALNALKSAELRQAQARLVEMGYGIGHNAVVAFQKYEGRRVTGQLNREEVDAIMNASAPQPRDAGYKHVEVDLDRQILLLVDDDGAIKKILPVSTGSNKHYSEKGMIGLAY